MIDAVEQLFKAMMGHVDQDSPGDFETPFRLTSIGATALQAGLDIRAINEDLHAMLTEKADTESAIKLKASGQGQGIMSYMAICKH